MLDRLRWRLTLGYAVIFALLLLLLGTATVLAARSHGRRGPPKSARPQPETIWPSLGVVATNVLNVIRGDSQSCLLAL
jgi:hypothetical protein